jgi:hypothetical protein
VSVTIEVTQDLSKLTLEDAGGRLRVVEDRAMEDDALPPPRVDGKLLLTEEQWKEKMRQRSNTGQGSSGGDEQRRRPRKRGNGGKKGTQRDDKCHNYVRTGHWARDCHQPRKERINLTQAEDDDEPEEIDSVKRNQTWELVDLPQGHRAITLKWVYKLKRNEAGEIVKHKARLVARGFVQQEGIDFNEVFASVARMESVRLLALAAQEGWQVHHMDVKSAFLNGDLKEEVYVRQPVGFIIADQEGKVLRLRKALYDLWQAPRAWNSKLDDTLKKMDFV